MDSPPIQIDLDNTSHDGVLVDAAVTLPSVVNSVRVARRFVRALLAGTPVADDGELIVSELATHAFWRTSSRSVGRFHVHVKGGDGVFRIEVYDDPAGRYSREANDAVTHAMSGCELALVSLVASRFGSRSDRFVHLVWAELHWDDDVPRGRASMALPVGRRTCWLTKMQEAAEDDAVSPRPTAWGAYAQIAEVLRQRIATKELVPGQPFPSESALSAEFSVARNTVRRALAELEAEGLTRTVPGTGRIVREPGSTDDAEGAQPQYRRIAAELRARIDSGELAPGDPVPSEATVARNFRVSRGTARQALTDLEGAGLIVAVPGKGRFVRVTEEPER